MLALAGLVCAELDPGLDGLDEFAETLFELAVVGLLYVDAAAKTENKTFICLLLATKAFQVDH